MLWAGCTALDKMEKLSLSPTHEHFVTEGTRFDQSHNDVAAQVNNGYVIKPFH